MATPTFLQFTPVPLRSRYDGWSPEAQRRFVAALARGARPVEAAARLGLSRQSAYKLRRLPGAESFAAAWDSALLHARRAREGPPPGRGPAGVEAAAGGAHPEARRQPWERGGFMRDEFDRMLASLRAHRPLEGDKGDKGDRNRR